MNLHWCGPRLSDINNINIFNKSTTIFGDGVLNNTSFCYEKKHRINHNIDNLELGVFIENNLIKEIEQNEELKIMHYNPYYAYEYCDSIVTHSVCLNARSTLAALDEKLETKIWMADSCNNIPSVVLPLKECTESELKKLFPNANKFVLQKNISSGGFGTRILNYKQTSNTVINDWDSDKKLLVTPYLYPSIPINIHIIIFEEEVLLLTPSIQLICPNSRGQLIYRGADYAEYNYLNDKIKTSVLNSARIIGEKLRRYEYRGVAGIDFLWHRDDLYFIEINARFQASTALLNKALLANGFISVQELNLQAFQTPKFEKKILIINVPYSNFCYDTNDMITKHILNCSKNHDIIEIDLDGYDGGESDDNSYQFRINFPYNISSIDPNGCVNIHDNILGSYLISDINHHKIIQIKFELLNQGIIIKESALNYINQTGKIRSAVFDAVDITIFDNLKVNCPYNVKLSEFSPYSIDIENNILILKRYEQTISTVFIHMADILSDCKTSNNIEYRRISTLATDRVRINHTRICYYKEISRGCAFCNLPEQKLFYDFNEIYQIIDAYLNECDFRHFLIGGGSNHGFTEIERIIKITEYIKHKCNKPIYVMCLPPEKSEWVSMLYEAGINEIAFNIEIFDREIAKKIMPGKGLISLQHYFDKLEQAVGLWGKNGNVKSLVILGLERQETLMEGIHRLCQIGVQPVLSAFRPLKNTSLENNVPMPTGQILDTFWEAENLCKNYGLHLGPSCSDCQNNTVSFPSDYRFSSFFLDYQKRF